MRIIYIIPLIILAALASCISQFTPEIVSQNRFLTVNGLITDDNRSYIIRLGLSRPLDVSSEEEPATGAVVYVSDDTGNTFLFVEKRAGYYYSDSTVFTGQPGKSYTLHINHSGVEYRSSPCLLRKAPPVDSVGYEVIEREINASGETEQAVRIMLNTFDATSDNHYFRWTYDETWEINLPFNNVPIEKKICWRHEESQNILAANTEALSEDRISDLTITTFNNSTNRGQHKYSINVHQYSTSREEYEFWNSVKTISENTGGLYDVTPVTVTGNVICLTNPGDAVLGFFSVSGVSHKRIFITRPLVVPDIYNAQCIEETIDVNYHLPGLGTYIFILNIIDTDGTPPPERWDITSNISCTDCSYFASNVKPDYWDEGFND
ncbi:MAG: DUF4249 domain-containing protein [Bacteroidales bacterium]|jgi:hypothetical protein|nr:DUF4249 domain-containing protein [Bacteroidales bacterium]